jgi:hypothetical protein
MAKQAKDPVPSIAMALVDTQLGKVPFSKICFDLGSLAKTCESARFSENHHLVVAGGAARRPRPAAAEIGFDLGSLAKTCESAHSGKNRHLVVRKPKDAIHDQYQRRSALKSDDWQRLANMNDLVKTTIWGSAVRRRVCPAVATGTTSSTWIWTA